MNILLSFCLGILTWPILEYLLHRFLGHVLKLNTLFKKEHTRHHAETNYFAPLTYKLLAAIPICLVSFSLTALVSSSWKVGASFTVGFIAMYSVYEWVHWSFHALAPRTQFGLLLRKHHFAHHFHNPKMNHGVTTRLIDRLAGTYKPFDVIKVPRHIALPWLFEANSDVIAERFRKDFELK